MGGSSSLNGMVYMRGDPSDYDAWARGAQSVWAMKTYARISRWWKMRSICPIRTWATEVRSTSNTVLSTTSIHPLRRSCRQRGDGDTGSSPISTVLTGWLALRTSRPIRAEAGGSAREKATSSPPYLAQTSRYFRAARQYVFVFRVMIALG